jgi:hypothetical protein
MMPGRERNRRPFVGGNDMPPRWGMDRDVR